MTPDLLPPALAHALGWTLLHSLWQACLAALVVAWLLSVYRQPRLRYWAAYGGMVAVLLFSLLTFMCVYQPQSASLLVAEGGEDNLLTDNSFVMPALLSSWGWDQVVPALESRYPYLVTGWLCGCLLLLLRLGGGYWLVYRLRRHGLVQAVPQWQELLNELGSRLGVKRAVGLFESARVRVPVALGYFKPLVLLPVGLLNRLSPSEVEAVLAHELAHIARHDWLFNLLQGLLESLFYYHPAVWWMSGMARRERETCCDEQAIALCGNPIQYAKVLVRVQELATPVLTGPLVLGLDGGHIAPVARRRMLLLERVKRILHSPQHNSHNMEKTIATAGLLALLVFAGLRATGPQSLGTAWAQVNSLPDDFLTSTAPDYQAVGDSLPRPKGKQRISREDDRQRVEAEYQDGRVTKLSINGEAIPATDFDKHRTLTDELLRDLSTPPTPPAPPFPPRGWGDAPPPPAPPAPPRLTTVKNADGSIMLLIDSGEDTPVEIRILNGETWVNGKKLAEGESLDLPGLSGFAPFNWPDDMDPAVAPDVDVEVDLRDGGHAPASPRLQHLQIIEEQHRALEESRRDIQQQQREIEREIHRQQRQLDSEVKRAQVQQRLMLRDQERAARDADYHRQEMEARNAEAVAYWGKQLQRDGLIADPNRFSIVLTAKKMTVNGKKQSAELHRKYRDLYEQRTKGEFPLTDKNKLTIEVN